MRCFRDGFLLLYCVCVGSLCMFFSASTFESHSVPQLKFENKIKYEYIQTHTRVHAYPKKQQQQQYTQKNSSPINIKFCNIYFHNKYSVERQNGCFDCVGLIRLWKRFGQLFQQIEHNASVRVLACVCLVYMHIVANANYINLSLSLSISLKHCAGLYPLQIIRVHTFICIWPTREHCAKLCEFPYRIATRVRACVRAHTYTQQFSRAAAAAAVRNAPHRPET